MQIFIHTVWMQKMTVPQRCPPVVGGRAPFLPQERSPLTAPHAQPPVLYRISSLNILMLCAERQPSQTHWCPSPAPLTQGCHQAAALGQEHPACPPAMCTSPGVSAASSHVADRADFLQAKFLGDDGQ